MSVPGSPGRRWVLSWLVAVAASACSDDVSTPNESWSGLSRPFLELHVHGDPNAGGAIEGAPPGWLEALETGEPGLVRRGPEERFGWTGRPGSVWAFDIGPGTGSNPPPGARLALSLAAWGEGASSVLGDRALVRLVPQADEAGARELARVAADAPERWTELDVPLGSIDGPARVEIELGGSQFTAMADVAVYVPSEQPATVLLITSDTHRGDHLSLVGEPGRVATPALAKLAERGRAFVDCFSTSNITVPSHVALMTGLHPRDTGVRDNQTAVATEARTLAEVFRSAGFATYGVTSISLLSDQHSGLGQGFDRFSSTQRRRSGVDSIEILRGWLSATRERPVFLWLHLFDAHGPYRPPAALIPLEWSEGRDPRDPSLPEPEGRVPDWAEGVRDLEYVRALYRSCVRFVDLALDRLLSHPRMKTAIVAFTADHGEVLGEHDIWWAHQGIFPDTLHVPLILAWPGADGAITDRPVRQIDIGRTLLDLAGLHDVPFEGRSLVPAGPSGEDAWPRFALSERALSMSITWQGWHLIRHLEDHPRGAAQRPLQAGQRELFDLSEDPAALHDRSDVEPDRLERLDGLLQRWWAERQDQGVSGARRDDEETRRRLRELGYLDDEGE